MISPQHGLHLVFYFQATVRFPGMSGEHRFGVDDIRKVFAVTICPVHASSAAESSE